MQDAWCREMFPHQSVHALPSPPLLTLLAASSQRVEPQFVNFVGELLQPTFVARNRVVIEPSAHDRCQPACRVAQWTMHAFVQLSLNCNERHSHAFGNAVSSDREPPMSSRLVAHVREAEKVKRLGTPFASSLSLLGRIAAELDQTSFLLVQLQAEFGKACSEHFQAGRCLLATLETHHKVIRVADDDDVAPGVVFTPPLDPQVEHVVQEHICQEWRYRPTNNLAKSGLTFDIVIPRSRLRPIRGQGPDFIKAQVDKEVTSTQSVGGDVHGGKKPKEKDETEGST